MPGYKVLTPQEIEQFVEEGYVIVRGAMPPDAIGPIQKRIWEKIGLSPDKPEGWTKTFIHLQESISGPDVDRVFSTKLRGAMDDLMGEGRWEYNGLLGWWPVSFPGHGTPPWTVPTGGWHADGSWFHHHVYSKEQGILSINLFSDIDPGGGGTAILPRSHKYVARFLAAHEPEGKSPNGPEAKLHEYVAEHKDQVIEVTGKTGDVALMHPFMVHAVSSNTGNRVRMVCNPCQSLKEHMNLRRERMEDYSPVELAIVRAAGDLLRVAPLTVGAGC